VLGESRSRWLADLSYAKLTVFKKKIFGGRDQRRHEQYVSSKKCYARNFAMLSLAFSDWYFCV
jgi:hypothetical protein